MTLIVFAILREAKPAIARLNAKPVDGETKSIWPDGEIPSCYTFEGGKIAISNIGLHSAQSTVMKHAHDCQEIWNFGLAGSLRDTLPIGEFLPIERVGKYIPIELDPVSEEMVKSSLPHFSLLEAKKSGALISSDFPIHDAEHRERLATKWDLVDMEGYGIAHAAHHLGKKCRMWKVISDFASPGGRELIRKNIDKLSEQVADLIMEELL